MLIKNGTVNASYLRRAVKQAVWRYKSKQRKKIDEEINKIKLAFLLCMADNKSRELLVKVVNCDEEYRFDRGFGCCQRRSPS